MAEVAINANPAWSVKVNLTKLREGAPAPRGEGRRCNCELCRELYAKIEEKNGDVGLAMQALEAKAKRDKLSIVVETPGLYSLESLEEKSGGLFKNVFFAFAGKFSVVKINTMIEDERADAELIADVSETETVKKIIKELKILPVGLSIKKFVEDPSMKKIFQDLEKTLADKGVDLGKKVAKNSIEEIFKDSFKLDGKIVPIVKSGLSYLLVDKDGATSDLFETIKVDNKNSSAYYLHGLLNGKFIDEVSFIGLDVGSSSLIWAPEVDEWIYATAKSDNNGFKEKMKLLKKVGMSTGEFIKKVNQYLGESKFASGFTVTSANPMMVQITYQEHDWVGGAGKNHNKSKPGFNINVSYKGAPLIGTNGSQGGHAYARPNDKGGFTLMQSSWCQRITSWSKNIAGVVDQLYDVWDLADWLSGPFAEKCDLKIIEAPIVFFGAKTKNSKESVLEKMKQKLKMK